jgi:chromosome segregation ATPase
VLLERLERLERRREELGRVNPLAAEEYEREMESLARATTRMGDGVSQVVSRRLPRDAAAEAA